MSFSKRKVWAEASLPGDGGGGGGGSGDDGAGAGGDRAEITATKRANTMKNFIFCWFVWSSIKYILLKNWCYLSRCDWTNDDIMIDSSIYSLIFFWFNKINSLEELFYIQNEKYGGNCDYYINFFFYFADKCNFTLKQWSI